MQWHTESHTNVSIPVESRSLHGMLTLPGAATGLVLCAHGAGSRFSPDLSSRTPLVASVLQEAGLGTLSVDLLTESDAMCPGNVSDIAMLADRLNATIRWMTAAYATADMPVGLLSCSTGAAAALIAAARLPGVRAVVSHGGRPELASEWLVAVRAPTLLIVGGRDRDVLSLNREAWAELCCEKELAVIPGAGHLFDEPGKLAHVAALARNWFLAHFALEFIA